MRSGILRHRITIQSRSTTQDEAGQPVTVWTDFAANVPAAIRPLSSREQMSAQARQSAISHKITLRYIPGVTAEMRAVCNERIFDLGRPMDAEERNIEMVIPAAEGLNDG